MALTYNIKEDIRYQQGYAEGLKSYRIEMIKEMLLDSDFTIEQIMRYTKSSKEFVEEIAKQIKK